MEGCGGACKFKQTIRVGRIVCLREMLTDETGGKNGKRGAGEALNSLCVFPSQMSRLFCLCGGKTVFVAWHHVFRVLFEGEDCHDKKKGYQPLKNTGKTKDMAASLIRISRFIMENKHFIIVIISRQYWFWLQ